MQTTENLNLERVPIRSNGLLAEMREARERLNQYQAGSDKWWVALYDLQKAERDYDAANTTITDPHPTKD